MSSSRVPKESPALAALLGALLLGACSPPDRPTPGTGGGMAGADPDAPAPALAHLSLPGGALFQAVSAPSAEVVWVSGHQGSWARTTDGGATWSVSTVQGEETRQFRDVHAFGPDTAVLMSSGEGDASGIFRTTDGGRTWERVFTMDHPAGFLDCMDFWEDGTGIAFGDAVDGGLYLLKSTDGGRSWNRLDPAGLPPALEGEGAFAASGSCLRSGPGEAGWIATGNGERPRILSTMDRGRTWTATDVPLAAGEARGATSVGLRADGLGFALGGDISGEDEGARVALTADGGRSWFAVGELPFPGAAYGAAWVPDRDPATLFAVGPGGMGWSRDGGMTWSRVDTLPYWAVEFSSPAAGWAVGPSGRLTRIAPGP